ncbi:DUF418 domain-containing protein [Marinilabiliaceae bacterium ANBcel2]|nr:DUF418 domain-containing protein [Marinilabiliaceae bacterium ANBcel2]
MNSAVSPVKQVNRIVLLDTLRGFAIFGILMVNFPIMFQPVTSVLLGSQSDGSILYNISEWFIKFFFEGKFYVIFSMLFGYGFWLFMNKKVDGGKSITPIFKRRLLFLFLFGALHVVLLWAGDILVYYTLFGFILLLLFRRVSDRGLIKWAIWIGAIPGVLALLSAMMLELASVNPDVSTEIKVGFAERLAFLEGFNQKAIEMYSSGSFAEIISIRLTEYRMLLPGLLFFYPVVLSMFLVGFWAARRGLVSNYTNNIPFFRRVFWWGLVIGVATSMLYTISFKHANPFIPGVWETINAVSHTLGGVFLGLCYVSAIILLHANGRAGALIKLFAPVGRMALTNYIIHSIIAVILFHSIGFGLFGKIELWHGVLLSFLIFALQIPFSILWLRYFRFGPLEWLWRSLTYLKVQSFKQDRRP